jgi:ATP-dependent Clp protease ATP-binding subunit ClpA
MGRLLQQKIKEPLAEELLFGQLQHGGQAVVEVVEDDIRLVIPAVPAAT